MQWHHLITQFWAADIVNGSMIVNKCKKETNLTQTPEISLRQVIYFISLDWTPLCEWPRGGNPRVHVQATLIPGWHKVMWYVIIDTILDPKYPSHKIIHFPGNFTCLAVFFNLKRRLGYHLFHTYIPSALIVVMSWISFWIKPEAIPARVTLGVTSLLTLGKYHKIICIQLI